MPDTIADKSKHKLWRGFVLLFAVLGLIALFLALVPVVIALILSGFIAGMTDVIIHPASYAPHRLREELLNKASDDG